MKRLTFLLIFFAACCFAKAEKVWPNNEASGQEIAAELRSAAPDQSSDFRGILRIRSKKEKITNDVPVICHVIAEGKIWKTIYETIPTDQTPPEKLIVRRHANGPNEYLYAKAPAPWAELPEPRKLSPEEANIPFAGSDFWLTDLGLEFLHWPKQRRVAGEMRLGQACHVLESVNPNGGKIARVKSWIDIDTGGILIAEAYDSEGKLVKEFSLSGSSFKKVNGQWQLEKMEIRSPKTGSKTMLQFDLEN